MRYFLRNPQAADTLDGVTRWRLLEQQLYHTTEEVRRALDFLVSEGFLVKTSQVGTTAIFHLNEESAEDAEVFFDTHEG